MTTESSLADSVWFPIVLIAAGIIYGCLAYSRSKPEEIRWDAEFGTLAVSQVLATFGIVWLYRDSNPFLALFGTWLAFPIVRRFTAKRSSSF